MDRRVQTVVEVLNDDLHRRLPLKQIASRVNLSPSRLRHIFKAELGVSPTQYCKELRMLKAKELIETSFLNMKQIMITVGASNKNSFARDFKRAYGFTPSVYRARYNRNLSNANQTTHKQRAKS